MKCPNCGAETNDKYCSLCGMKMPEENIEVQNNNRNPYQSIPFGDSIPNSPNVQQAMPDFAQGDIPAEAKLFMPEFRPDLNYPLPAAPSGEFKPYKQRRALPIVILILVAAVCIAGAVISVVSSTIYNVDIYNDLSDDGDNYYDDISKTVVSEKDMKIGEVYSFVDGEFTLASAEKLDKESESGPGYDDYELTVEIKSNDNIKVSILDVSLNSDYQSYYVDSDDTLYSSDYVYIKENETRTAKFVSSVPKSENMEDFSVEFIVETIGKDAEYTEHKIYYAPWKK